MLHLTKLGETPKRMSNGRGWGSCCEGSMAVKGAPGDAGQLSSAPTAVNQEKCPGLIFNSITNTYSRKNNLFSFWEERA